jgi:trypsin
MKYTVCILLYSTLCLVNSVYSLHNGQNVVVGQYPAHALVLVSNNPFGGAIINPTHVLTACGNVLNAQNNLIPINTVTVRVGSVAFTEGIVSTVSAIFPHPEYNPWTFNHDIAVLRTVATFQFNFTIPNPNIAPAILNERVIGDTSSCWVVGFVIPSAGNLNPPLQHVEQPILNRDIPCNEQINHNGRVLGTMICAGVTTAASGICPSTRGGGLYCNGNLTGIASSGFGCSTANSPGIYTEVRQHLPWINAQLTRTQIPAEGTTPIPGSTASISVVTSSLLMCLAFLLTKL